MRNAFFTLLFLTCFIASGALAQMADKADIGDIMQKNYLGLEPAGKPFSLIDLSKLQWSHSYSISFFSGGGTSGSYGLYTGQVLYEISPSLSLNLKLGIGHDPGSFFDRRQGNDAVFLPGMQLEYHPSPDFRISAGFDTYTGGNYYLYNPYNYRTNYWR